MSTADNLYATSKKLQVPIVSIHLGYRGFERSHRLRFFGAMMDISTIQNVIHAIIYIIKESGLGQNKQVERIILLY